MSAAILALAQEVLANVDAESEFLDCIAAGLSEIARAISINEGHCSPSAWTAFCAVQLILAGVRAAPNGTFEERKAFVESHIIHLANK